MRAVSDKHLQTADVAAVLVTGTRFGDIHAVYGGGSTVMQ